VKLFERSGGHYLFWCGFVYLFGGLAVALSPYSQYTYMLTILWISALAFPLTYPPLARYLNMKETHMFDWMKKKEPTNVVPFPNAYEPPKTPYVDPVPTPKKESKTYYTMGLTDDNRVSFQMGYTTLTMNDAGVQQLIDQLEFFKNQLTEH